MGNYRLSKSGTGVFPGFGDLLLMKLDCALKFRQLRTGRISFVKKVLSLALHRYHLLIQPGFLQQVGITG